MIIRNARKSDLNDYSELRIASLKDYQKLTKDKLNLSKRQTIKEFNGIIANSKSILFVAEERGNMVGIIIGNLLKNSYQKSAYLDEVFIRSSERGKGYGKRLMFHFIKWAKSKKVDKIRLGVRVKNTNAIKLYEKLGFKTEGLEMEKAI